MARDDSLLGTFEEHVLLALLHAGDEAYGMQVRRELESRLGRSVAIGAVYATLDRLEGKAYVASRLQDAGDGPRRGRPRRFFRLAPAGVQALAEAREAHRLMWEDVELDAPGRP